MLDSLRYLTREGLVVYSDVIIENPVKRGYVEFVEHWRYSSARNYLGQQGLLEASTAW